jgi:predicted nucleotidyltransferase
MKKVEHVVPGTLREAVAIARRNAAREMKLATLPRDRVVLFGSRAAGAARPSSDWDVLLVDKRAASGPSRKVQVRDLARGVDVVVVPALDDEAFLRSELGAHVAWYGLGVTEPLPDLRGRVNYRHALERGPIRRIHSKLRLLLSVHPRVRRYSKDTWAGPIMRDHAARVVLDIVRASHLEQHRGSPPSLRLAEEWTTCGADGRARLIARVVEARALFPDGREVWTRWRGLLDAAWLVLNDRIARAEALPRTGGYT